MDYAGVTCQQYDMGVLTMCNKCIHKPVCSKFLATGGVGKCEHFREEKRGYWMPQVLLGERIWDCSNCKTIGSLAWKRCPVCDAKMSGYSGGLFDTVSNIDWSAKE